MGGCLYGNGEIIKSKSAYEGALKIDSNNIKAKQGMFAANLISGKSKIALDCLDSATESIEIARICNLKGIKMVESGSYDVAERLYKNAVKLIRNNKEVVYKLWLNLGLCAKKNSDYKEALKCFEKCKDSAPKDYTKVDQHINAIKKLLKGIPLKKAS